ncbi:hypothetical protein [Endozoicomonas euniceicola]|uniref:Uncharacterized protein n=1 Tax=Endozoicomonas euniceicola TaxID=1234143 RepID=A0ABY6GTS9_9GAMM|nr:hypothetical protein [Endozoicomonas euniceicola]UYM15448.1 hypothetical protein NX720_21770 [Endozoicomonas euniceicola]
MLKNIKKLLICTTSLPLMLLLAAATHIGADQTSQPNNPVSKAREQLKNLQILTEAPELDYEKLEQMEKNLKKTRFDLGNCKNKNMDNEVINLQLLQEMEGLEKELKAC